MKRSAVMPVVFVFCSQAVAVLVITGELLLADRAPIFARHGAGTGAPRNPARPWSAPRRGGRRSSCRHARRTTPLAGAVDVRTDRTARSDAASRARTHRVAIGGAPGLRRSRQRAAAAATIASPGRARGAVGVVDVRKSQLLRTARGGALRVPSGYAAPHANAGSRIVSIRRSCAIARECNWHTRASLTPISLPISRSVRDAP